MKGTLQTSLEVAEDRVAPRQNLRRVGAIRALHLAIVANADRFETEVGGEAIRARRGAAGVNDASDERAEIFFESYPSSRTAAPLKKPRWGPPLAGFEVITYGRF